MVCAFHVPAKPRSANKSPKASYSQLLAKAAAAQYAGPKFTKPLYSRIVWFHKYVSTEGDADNIAKRVHDSLKGVLFDDDRLISHTIAIRVDATHEVEIVPDPAYPSPALALGETLSDQEVRDVLYVELGPQQERRIFLGPLL